MDKPRIAQQNEKELTTIMKLALLYIAE